MNVKPTVLVLPGWQGSGSEHWQTRWERLHGYQRVDQHDWLHPRRGDWLARLDEVMVDTQGPVVLVAHSLGCALVAAWAQFSRHTQKVRAALLVAPPDTSQEPLRSALPGWSPLVLSALPFPSVVVASTDDPYCSLERSRDFAQAWGSTCVDVGACGHINAESDVGDWPEGHSLLLPWVS